MKWLCPGVLLMAAVAFMQSCFSLIVKTVSTDISTGLQVLVYYLLPFVFLLPLLWRQGKQLYATPYFAWHCLRGSLAAAAVFCFFYSASHLSLAMEAILFNSTPVFIPLFAWLFLGERTSLRVYGGILLALLGVVLALHPTMTQGQWHLGLIALAAGVLMALSRCCCVLWP
jgi:drug/metabolite transporter (DMT)-like permease